MSNTTEGSTYKPICARCWKPIHQYPSFGWCDDTFGSPVCRLPGGHIPEEEQAQIERLAREALILPPATPLELYERAVHLLEGARAVLRLAELTGPASEYHAINAFLAEELRRDSFGYRAASQNAEAAREREKA